MSNSKVEKSIDLQSYLKLEENLNKISEKIKNIITEEDIKDNLIEDFKNINNIEICAYCDDFDLSNEYTIADNIKEDFKNKILCKQTILNMLNKTDIRTDLGSIKDENLNKFIKFTKNKIFYKLINNNVNSISNFLQNNQNEIENIFIYFKVLNNQLCLIKNELSMIKKYIIQ